MTHNEAVQQMAAERYLLGELTADVRDAFEEHVFECQECALDLRAASAFVDEARVQLPALRGAKVKVEAEPKRDWLAWMRPAFAMPAFAALILIIGYQNLETIPGLRRAASEPQVLPWASVHAGTRGSEAIPVVADREHGVTLLVDLPQQSVYTAYSFELIDPQGHSAWKSSRAVPGENTNGAISVVVPGQDLHEGSYMMAISGSLPTGQSTEISRRALQISFGN